MARFKHTGDRLKQLRGQSAQRGREIALDAAERDLGRKLTTSEMRKISNEVTATLNKLPVYGGE